MTGFYDDPPITIPVFRDMSGAPSRGMEPETAREVTQAVNHDYDGHCRVTETQEFMTKMLPVGDKVIKYVRKIMEDSGFYVDSRWVDFPKVEDNPKEGALYPAFIKIANAIRNAAVTAMNDQENSDYLGASKWVDCHSKAPMSHDTNGARIRPDALLALDLLNQQIEQLEAQKAKSVALWWQQVLAVVEMKRTSAANVSDWVDLIKQTIGYLRRVLREQLDRRFVFGFTLSPSQLIVLLHDRSGVLVTDKSIDIHKDPDSFIRLISAFVVLKADKLGFDPSMKLYDESTGIATPSYRFNKPPYFKSHYEMRWVIKMNDKTEYLTTKTLSISRAEIMRGRGTLAWTVIPHNGRPSAGSKKVSEATKVFVLKQSWRPVAVDREDYFYEFANGSESENVAKIHLCEEVEIEAKKDETATLIRQGLIPKPPPTPATGEKRPRDEAHEPYLHIYTTDKKGIALFEDASAISPTPRVRTRTVMETYGWPLRHFIDLTELLQALQGAIQGHKHLYTNGVLHRDISSGNIIIRWKPSSGLTSAVPSYGGCLIDLDRAKVGLKNDPDIAIPIAPPQPPADGADMMYLQFKARDITVEATNIVKGIADKVDILKARINLGLPIVDALKDSQRLQVQTDVYQWASSLHLGHHSATYAQQAVAHLVRFGHLSDTGVCSATNLDWNQISKPYNFEVPSPSGNQGSMTGTPPFASYEILSQDSRYFPSLDETSSVYHDAVHDLESFFWVLVHICLTRKGPGGQRREELANVEKSPSNSTGDSESENISDDRVPEATRRLRTVVFHLFDNFKTLDKNKLRIFTRNMTKLHFEEHIIGHFHPYFEPLKPLVLEWYSLLRLAHEFHGYEYHAIHDAVLKIFDETLQTLKTDKRDLDHDGRKELELRKQDIEVIMGRAVKQTPTHPWETSPQGPDSQVHPRQPRQVPNSPSPLSRNKKPRVPANASGHA